MDKRANPFLRLKSVYSIISLGRRVGKENMQLFFVAWMNRAQSCIKNLVFGLIWDFISTGRFRWPCQFEKNMTGLENLPT
jgi:hypothetical protein